MPGVVWSLLWLILLVVVWPIGILCAIIYMILGPIAACVSPFTDVVNLAGEGMQLPITVARNMATSKPMI